MDINLYVNALKGYEIHVAFLFTVLWVLAVFGAVRRGNVTVLYVLNKLGIGAYSTKIDSDFRVVKKLNPECIAWLSVPNAVYAPVMVDAGSYGKRNYVKKPSLTGELGLSRDRVSSLFKSLALDDNWVGDMVVIEGKDAIRNANLRNGQFTFLERYTKTDLHNTNPITHLHTSEGSRKFKLIGRLDFTLEMKKNFVVKDRNSLIDLLYQQTGSNLKPVYDKNILFLRTSSGLDVSYVVLQEID